MLPRPVHLGAARIIGRRFSREELGRIVMAMLGNNATIMINGRLTFFISGM
jgi:hypothetical protein